MYKVKDIFKTIQGEGFNTGKAALFLRFAGCNLWSGLEQERGKGKGDCSRWCDTDFVGGIKYNIDKLVNTILYLAKDIRFLVITGGEPLLQLDKELVYELHNNQFYIAIETNGTIKTELDIDWICMSPKLGLEIKQQTGNELKFIYPQANLTPDIFKNWKFEHFFIQPMDGIDIVKNTADAVEYVKNNPNWRLSLQTHKYINIP